MHRIYELKDKVVKELAKYGEKDHLDVNEYQVCDMLAHLAKNLCKVIESYEEEDQYSEIGSYGGRVNFSGNTSMMSPEMGMSMGRGRYAKRNALGQYSSTDNFHMELQNLMNNAPNEHVRQKLASVMNEV